MRYILRQQHNKFEKTMKGEFFVKRNRFVKVLTILLVLAVFGMGEVFGQNICRIGSTEFATLNAAVSYARPNLGGTATIEMLTDYLVLQTDLVILNVMGNKCIWF